MYSRTNACFLVHIALGFLHVSGVPTSRDCLDLRWLKKQSEFFRLFYYFFIYVAFHHSLLEKVKLQSHSVLLSFVIKVGVKG